MCLPRSGANFSFSRTSMPVFTRGLAFLPLGADGFIECADGIAAIERVATIKIERNEIDERKAVRLSRINPCAIYSEDMAASIEEALARKYSFPESIQRTIKITIPRSIQEIGRE